MEVSKATPEIDDTVLHVNDFRIRDVAIDHPAMRCAAALVSYHDGELRCIGTGFFIYPGLAVTAEHVVRDWMTFQERRDGYKNDDSVVGVTAIQLVDGKMLEWSVEAAHTLWTADLALLTLRKPSWWGDGEGQVKLEFPKLNMNPPAPGSAIRVFGFPESSVEERVLTVSACESIGRVREVVMKFPSSFRPTSYVELDGEIKPGMSGGPCFDEQMNIIGVCSKGTDCDPPLAYPSTWRPR